MLFSAELCVALDEVLLKEKKKSSNLKKKNHTMTFR